MLDGIKRNSHINIFIKKELRYYAIEKKLHVAYESFEKYQGGTKGSDNPSHA